MFFCLATEGINKSLSNNSLAINALFYQKLIKANKVILRSNSINAVKMETHIKFI